MKYTREEKVELENFTLELDPTTFGRLVNLANQRGEHVNETVRILLDRWDKFVGKFSR